MKKTSKKNISLSLKTKNTQFSPFLRVEVAKNDGSISHPAIVAFETTKKGGPGLKKGYENFKDLCAKLNESGELSFHAGAMCMVRFAHLNGHTHALLVSLGKDKEGVNKMGAVERLRRLGAMAAQKLQAEKVKNAAVYLDSFLSKDSGMHLSDETAAAAFIEGFGLACYKFGKYLTTEKATHPFELVVLASNSSVASKYEAGLRIAKALVTGIELCRNFGNEPSNELYPRKYAEQVQSVAKAYGLKFTLLDEKQCKKEGMGLLLGVGQGSVNPPCLFLIEYKPAKAKSSIAFVGKGVTFDSGGISIKPSSRMEEMKHDMCGSAAVIGAVVAASMLKVNTHVIGVIAAAENMPDGNAIQPGNILRARNKKTVEVINTDAEGRLVLGDALDYIQDRNPDYIIDLATLTGAATITFGRACAGMMGNNQTFNKMVKTAAEASNERVWELPLFDEYFDDLKSDCADMRNSGDTPANGTAKGAMFLQQFIRKDAKWVHLDIASVASGVPNVPYYPRKASTGYGVRLLVALAEQIS